MSNRLNASALRRTTLLALTLVLCACGRGDESDRQQRAAQGAENGLPTPAGTGGVTGTPDVLPGPGAQGPALGGTPPPPPPSAEDLVIQELPDGGINPETGLGVDPDGDGPLTAPPAVDTGAAEPTAADAVALVRDYYAAINARDFARAHGLWANGGNASGQTTLQFAAGFADTQGVSVEVGAPGAQDAGAGQRYIQVPVSLSATHADGSIKRFVGRYVLHRTVVDGASADQRAWRIQSADLREVQP